jgi:hypothetical protein
MDNWFKMVFKIIFFRKKVVKVGIRREEEIRKEEKVEINMIS